ncbi:TetR/AcrR family transcriptional regulator [Marinifilum sp.]|uniref:TetR/AcrR family transcriptional regulator n=1 Tax=Marinifilum sp. TaxID=2033137 RepID=UPI003BAA45FF
MQVQKDNIRSKILKIAEEEFLKKGFKSVSMREISAKSDVGLSNIYNYFRNKNEILEEVLAPLLAAFNQLLEDHNQSKYIDKDIFTSEEYQLEHAETFVQLILKFKKELKLLLFHAHGSSYENFWDEFTDRHTETGFKYIQKMKEKYPQVNTNFS